MSLVNLIQLTHTFLGRTLFKDAGVQVEPGDRIGLVGPNGAGKTTLLRLIVGEIPPDGGEVRVARGTRLGYLPQDVYEVLSGPLLQSILDSIPERPALRREITRMEEALRDNPGEREQVEFAARLAEMHQTVNDLDTRFPAHSAEKILVGLGFREDDFPRPIESLSGGWKMRAALASLLYQNPDILLLDEPTNHLDLPSVRWLEEFLQTYNGALLLICHDRDFLNRQIRRTISFEPEGLRLYSGNFDFYLKAREEERRILEAKARNQDMKVKEAQRFIERFRAKSSKARQAQSKIKLVKKMELVNTHQNRKAIRFSFPPVERSGRDVLLLGDLSKSFGDMTLYQDLHLGVMRGERVGIVGPNGAGKTTLLRMIAGEMAPDQGQILLGHGVTLSYYAQHHSEMLDPKKTILEEVYQAVPHETVSFVRGVCGAFLFPGKDVEKTVGVLSGGERARVSLAKILVNPGNLMVMDEPTNHLDIVSSEVLIDALEDYQGTLVFVSHNQSFVNRLATRIWDIRDGQVIEYPGRLYEYLDHLSQSAERPLMPRNQRGESRDSGEPGEPPAPLQSRRLMRKERAERRGLVSSALKPIQNELLRIEEKIDFLEKRKDALEKTLADPEIFKDKARVLPLLDEYQDIRGELDGLVARWESKHEELQSAKKKLDI